MRRIDKIVVHWSGASAKQSVESIENHWRVTNGWGDIPGYHVIISADGTANRLYPDATPTYGVAGHNKHALHVCFIGNGKFTDAQEATLAKRVRYWHALYPAAKICGHRDLSPDKNHDGRITPDEWVKACPGFDTKAWCIGLGIDPNW